MKEILDIEEEMALNEATVSDLHQQLAQGAVVVSGIFACLESCSRRLIFGRRVLSRCTRKVSRKDSTSTEPKPLDRNTPRRCHIKSSANRSMYVDPSSYHPLPY
jgi:hypothetical protein